MSNVFVLIGVLTYFSSNNDLRHEIILDVFKKAEKCIETSEALESKYRKRRLKHGLKDAKFSCHKREVYE